MLFQTSAKQYYQKLWHISSQTEIITSQIQVTHSTTESKLFFISQTEGGIQNVIHKGEGHEPNTHYCHKYIENLSAILNSVL